MKLEQIGFYTLSDKRAATASASSPLQRCELVLTSRCNFRCPYCRSVGGKDIPYTDATNTLLLWIKQGMKNVRFSGGEPTLYRQLHFLISLCKANGVKNIAVSTNGSAPREVYDRLIQHGVTDFSVSLDACCAEDGDKMAGGIKGAWDKVVENIRYLSSRVYTTVGVVLTDANVDSIEGIIRLADSLGVSDIRIIPAAQNGDRLHVQVAEDLLRKYPILAYRIRNIQQGRPVRGLCATDSSKCGLVLDDIAACGDKHYPCIIYMREGGSPIGTMSESIRQDRETWYRNHDTRTDPICSQNCLDVCVDYNKTFDRANAERAADADVRRQYDGSQLCLYGKV